MDLLKFNPGLIIWTLVTFGFLLLVLWRVAWKPLLALLDERERSIREALEGAEKARKETENMARTHQEMLDRVKAEADGILNQGRAEVDRMRAELLGKARQEAEAILADGRKQLEREHRAAVQQLRTSVADLAIGAAERILVTGLDDKKQRQIIDEYLASLPEAESGTSRS